MSITFKRHYRLLLALVLVVAGLIILLPNTRIVAYSVAGSEEPAEYIINYDNDIDLFDDTVVHEIVVLISEENQKQMVTTYQETGEKDYFSADVIIDGVRINNVGIRLKGNASLRSLRGGMRGGQEGGMGGRPEGGMRGRPEGDIPDRPEGGGRFGEDRRPAGDGDVPMQGGDGMMPMSDSSNTGRVSYLVKFDEYVEGQRYQGYAKIALRSYGTSYDAAQLHEPVSNYVFNSVGVPISETAYISLQFNNDEPQLYAVVEEVDQVYIDRIFPDSEGVLYKVQQVGNSFTYLGEDPSSYDRAFSQETAKNDADLAPLIDFIRFVNEATDEEFARDLPKWLDVDAFASYLAINNLLMNYDSLAGMGNNYYLYYDEDRFTILAWDTNESLGKMSMGGSTNLDLYWQAVGSRFGGLFDDNTQQLDQTTNNPPRGRQGGGPGGRGGNHLLMTRFFATPEYLELYEEKLKTFYEQIFDGLLTSKIEEYAALVTAYNAEHNIVDQAEYDTAVASVMEFVTRRYDFLSTTELLAK
jgi:spore coat protein CotH